MARTRRTYTPEFKAEAVKLVTEQGYSIAEAARSLGLNENLIRSWKQSLEAKGIARESLDRVHAPIGLNIHARSPEEIGISILADLIYVRRTSPVVIPQRKHRHS